MVRRAAVVAVGGAVLGVLVLVMWAAHGPSQAQALTNCDTNEAGITPAEQQLLELINAARVSVGLNELKLSPSLNRAAAWKSEDPSATGAAGFPFSHTDSLGRIPGPDPRYPNARIRAIDCGYPAGAAENIAFGSQNAEVIFGMWMSSPGHRGNINGTALDGTIDPFWYNYSKGYKVIGIGQHGTAWTTDFGYRDDSGSDVLDGTVSRTAAASLTPSPTVPPSPTATATATPVPAAGVEVALSAGLNLLTYAGPEQPVGSALRSVGGEVAFVYAWDANAGWLRYGPGLPAYVNSFATMQPGRVYYIEMRIPSIWTY